MILVTGGTGLVGAHLLLQLIERGNLGSNQIRAIYRDPSSILKTKALFTHYQKSTLFDTIKWVQADILDVPSLEKVFTGIDYVYHCAALISFASKDENKLRKINIEGTANIVNFCLARNIKKLCHISTIAALGDLAPNETVVTEESEWNPEKPHSDYAISKYGAEMEIWRGQQEGLAVIIVNPGVIIGPGFPDQGSGELFKKVSKGLSFYTSGTTGFVAVNDVVTSCVRLMESDIKNQKYILITENSSFKNILNAIADSLKVKKPSIAVSPLAMEVLWRADWITSFIFRKKRTLTKATARASYSTTLYSNDKIKAALKTNFTPITHYIQENKFL
ncbi:nucleoside-diphosphate-sugar epimerase [Flavobacterium sp. 7E]|uniref:NAD-dependent epimerase/dehydratase family protein n=1 Tax=Flavobacterium sp. 7E TaxID=2735898 RepID=UPI001570B3FF|nr:NAD-dependent epimerase/dehydratase family protein [Flavobacterium sp. 7E]NRS87137.1 nucleoside-diphosphate-sugar epimerase [Flavobacterium sp. 7E]